MTPEELKAWSAEESKKAASSMQRMEEAFANKDLESFTAHLRAYVYRKFLLGDASGDEDDIITLAKASSQRILALAGGNLAGLDISTGCTGADTPTTKKMVMILTISKKMGVSIPPTEAPDITTLVEFAESLFRHRER